jgi:PAS domain S-box-containing protein
MGCALLLLLLLPAVALGDEPPKNVLLFDSDDTSLPANVLADQALRSTLRELWKAPIQIYDEGQDSLRIPSEKYEAELLSLLHRKYQGMHFDLIFAAGPPALRFLLKHQNELFAGSPIVFLATDPSRIADLTLTSNVTGVATKVELAPTLELALAVQPQTQRVVVIAGNAPIDQGLLVLAKNEFRAYEGRVAFTYLTDFTPEEIRQRLASLPDKSIIIFLSFNSDKAGTTYHSFEVVSQLASSSTAPIYGPSETFLGNGIVGGQLLSFAALGRAAGQMGVRILAGEMPQSIAVKTIPSVPMVDWRQLHRWGIDAAKLPPGTIVRYKELSAWDLYKWRIVGAISLMVLQSLLIAWLLVLRSRRRQAEFASERFASQAALEHKRLEAVVANVPGVVWESRVEPNTHLRKAEFVSPYVERLLGYSVEEWLSTPDFVSSITHEDDRERIAAEGEAIIATGKEGVLQFRWLAKNGDVVWVEAHVAAVRDETGKTVGLRGVTMNITDRKQAEAALLERKEELSEAQRVAKVGSWEWDPPTDTVTWSEELYRIMGRDPSLPAISYEDHHTLYTTASWELLKAGVERALQQGLPYELELQMIHPSGRLIWTSARGEALKDGTGRILKLRGTLQDISERKQGEEDLQRAMAEVSELKNQLQEENIYLQEEIKLAHNFNEIVGRSDATKYVLFKIEQVAPTDTTVLITGETGTGKELVAHAIHSASARRDRPLVKVNCAALTPTLIESELFGHEKGSFTGATARKIGRFELANAATILLDEIGELPLELQGKLLRVIQEGEFERLGSSKTIKVDTRIIAATNRNLKAAVEQGSFREDLWYRLNVFPITVPPLRDRKEDIAGLVEHFVRRFSQKVGKGIVSIPPASMRILQDYSWPGNVRELANVLERAVINTNGSVLRIVDHFEKAHGEGHAHADKTLEEMEKEYIIRILESTGWRIEGRKGAARVLGLNPSTLRTRMSKLGIQKADHSSNLASAAQ